MLSKEASGLNATQRAEKANQYFNAMFSRPDAKNVQISASYDPATSTLTMSGTAKVDATFSRLIGQDKMPIGSSTTIKWGMSRLRVALALDNTGSMNDAGKMSALKTATKNHAAGGCDQQRRRLRLAHSVQQGRQRRREQLQR